PAETGAVLEDLYRTHADVARQLPIAAEKMGRTIACRRGCAECCHELIGVTHVEAHAIADFLAAPERAELRARVVARARAWVAAAGPRPVEALARSRAGDRDGHQALRREHALERLM